MCFFEKGKLLSKRKQLFFSDGKKRCISCGKIYGLKNKVCDCGSSNFTIIKSGFIGLFGSDLTIGEPTDDDLINAEGVIQRNNSKEKLIRIEVFPVLRWSDLENLFKNTLYFWENDIGPPPPVVDFLNNFVDSCKPVKFNKKKLNDGFFVDIITYDYGGFF